MWLFVFAIALHNLPEGMAIGVVFSQGDLSVGLPLTSAIAIQDIPEGLAVAMALKAAGLSPSRAVSVAAMSGLMEPVGALLGVGLASGLVLAYPIGLGLAAGAMIFVVSHEVIPETHRNGHQTPATLGLMAGFAVMMVLWIPRWAEACPASANAATRQVWPASVPLRARTVAPLPARRSAAGPLR